MVGRARRVNEFTLTVIHYKLYGTGRVYMELDTEWSDKLVHGT